MLKVLGLPSSEAFQEISDGIVKTYQKKSTYTDFLAMFPYDKLLDLSHQWTYIHFIDLPV